jgi:hypothetical protein
VRGGDRGGEDGARLVTSESVLACGIFVRSLALLLLLLLLLLACLACCCCS